MTNPPVPKSAYIPSTDQVRRSYDGQWDTASPHGPEAGAEFDRWLARYKRDVIERCASVAESVYPLGTRVHGNAPERIASAIRALA